MGCEASRCLTGPDLDISFQHSVGELRGRVQELERELTAAKSKQPLFARWPSLWGLTLFMASAGAAQRSQADPEVVNRLEAEVKRLGEQDLKRQAELVDLV